jgi:hypothetical protein
MKAISILSTGPDFTSVAELRLIFRGSFGLHDSGRSISSGLYGIVIFISPELFSSAEKKLVGIFGNSTSEDIVGTFSSTYELSGSAELRADAHMEKSKSPVAMRE